MIKKVVTCGRKVFKTSTFAIKKDYPMFCLSTFKNAKDFHRGMSMEKHSKCVLHTKGEPMGEYAFRAMHEIDRAIESAGCKDDTKIVAAVSWMIDF